MASVNAYRLLGADIELGEDWVVKGFSGYPCVPENVIDVGNSGTTLYIAMAAAALGGSTSVLTGDSQIVKRPAAPLIGALNLMGAQVRSTRRNGMPPIIIEGRASGGSLDLDGSKTSQYLTALLINCPMMDYPSEINVTNLVEKPYIEMTLEWIRSCGVEINHQNFEIFDIPGNQTYLPFDKNIPADYSSSAFFMCQAAINDQKVTLKGLDPKDTQGDKAVADMLRLMGASVEYTDEGAINFWW